MVEKFNANFLQCRGLNKKYIYMHALSIVNEVLPENSIKNLCFQFQNVAIRLKFRFSMFLYDFYRMRTFHLGFVP